MLLALSTVNLDGTYRTNTFEVSHDTFGMKRQLVWKVITKSKE